MTGEALSSGFPVQALLIREGYMPSFPVPSAIPAYTLTDSVFRSVCETKTPQGQYLPCRFQFSAFPSG